MLNKITSLFLSISSIAAIGASKVQAANQFSQLFIFGDSLSDVGNVNAPGADPIPAVAPLAGKNWAMALAEKYSITLDHSNVVNTPATYKNPTGTNFAWAGTMLTGTRLDPDFSAFPSIPDQVTSYFNSSLMPVDPGALYAVWGGANDIIDYLDRGLPTDTASIVAYSQLIASTLVQQLNRLNAAGAKYLLSFNLPDLGRTPLAAFLGQSAKISAFTAAVNTFINSAVSPILYNLVMIDTYSLSNYVLDNPSQFGLTNTTLPGNNAPGFFFFDPVHPSAAVSQLLGDAVFSIVQAPLHIAMIGDSALNQMKTYEQVINASLADFKGGDCHKSALTPIISLSYNHFRKGRRGTVSPGFHSNEGTLILGAHSCVSSAINLGFVIGQSFGKNTFSRKGGTFDENQTRTVLFATMKQGPIYLRGDVHASYLFAPNVKRSVHLGANKFTAKGNTHGHTYGALIEAGYWLHQSHLLSGPVVQLGLQRGQIDGFREHGSIPGTNLGFRKQNLKSYLGGFGWELRYNMSEIAPWGRIMAMVEKRNKRCVGAAVTTLSTPSFAMPIAATSMRPWMFSEINIDRKVSKYVNVSAGISADLFKKVQKANATSFAATLKVAF